MEKKNRRILVISPHCDDSEFGCGGYIAKSAANGDEIKIWVATSGSVYFGHLDRVVTGEERICECYNAAKCLGAEIHSIGFLEKDSMLDTVPYAEGVNVLDNIIANFQPHEILIPLPSFHQDHTWTYNVSIASTRINRNKYQPELIACYEYPLQKWGLGASQDPSRGGRYVNITDYIDTKVEALKCYKTQLGNNDEILSIESTVSLAKVRGYESAFCYAELFYTLRKRVE